MKPDHTQKKKIGAGLQYVVYDIGHERVLKLQKTAKQRAELLHHWDKTRNNIQIRREVLRAAEITRYSIEGLRRRMADFDPALFGDPIFYDNLSYEQNNVVILGNYFLTHSFVENTRVIRKYIRTILALWRSGCSDTIFNFTINYGIDRTGRVILCDIGEVTFNKREIQKRIKSQRWLTSWSYLTLKDERLKMFYRTEMKKHLALDVLEETWRTTSSPSLPR